MKKAMKNLSAHSKSLLALFLAFVFAFGAFSAFPKVALAEGAMMSGTVYWYYNDGNQTLSIRTSGDNASGTLDDSKGFGNGTWPWTGKSWKSQVKTVYFYNPSNSDRKRITTKKDYSLKSMFEGFSALETVDFAGLLDISKAKDISKMFKDCSSLTTLTGINGLDTFNIQDMQQMFSGCSSLTSLDLSNWKNDNKLYNMQYFVRNCTSLTSFTLNNEGFVTRTPNTNADGSANYSREGCQIGGFFEGCNALEYVDMSNITIGGRSDGAQGLGQGSLSSTSGVNGLFQNRTALTTVLMNNVKLPGMKNMRNMFKGCTSLETVKMNGIGKLYDIVTMGDMFLNCTSLTSIYLDGIDNSAIGPTTDYHSIVSGDVDLETARRIGASEFARDLGLKTCTSLTTLSVNDGKLWMVRNDAGTPSHEYYNAANDGDVFWWWYSGSNSQIKEEGTQLRFTSSETGETYVLNKRDYVDLITDRDGEGVKPEDQLPSPTPAPTPEPDEPDETPEPEETDEPGEGGDAIGTEVVTRGGSVPVKDGEGEGEGEDEGEDEGEYNLPKLIGTTDIGDRHTNINIVNGDLNPNGPGFLAPGVYEVTDEPWTEEHVDMTGSAYGIDFKGVSHHVEVNGETVTSYPFSIDADGDGYSDIVIVKGEKNTYINTTKRGDWPTSGDYTIDLSNHKIAFVYAGAATEQGTEIKRDIRIEFTSVTFKNLDRIPTNPHRDAHDSNRYYDTHGEEEYYRTIAQANAEDGIIFRNYLKISDPKTPGEGTSALSGGSGTDIDFTIKIDGAKSGLPFLFYSDDLDVGEHQNWVYPQSPLPDDACYDYLPYGNYTYGIGGESFVVHDSEEDVGPVRLAPKTGLIVVTNGDGSREVITTGSDPSTAWSEFSVLAKADGSDFTWKSGVACSTTALRNAVTNKETTEYVVYDFSNTLRYTLEPPTKDGEVITVAEGDVPMKILGINNKKKDTTATTKTIGKFTFVKSGNDTIDIRIKGITDATAELYALVQCDPNYSDAVLVWRKIVVMPATNVHYEETYLNYNADSSKNYAAEWSFEGKAKNPVYNVSGKGMTGSGKARQSGDNILYGYDETYAKQTGDSNNRSMKVTVGSDAFDKVKAKTHVWPEFSFTFTGTGFDIIGRTGMNTGVYVVKVRNSANKLVNSQIVNTRYFGSEWMGENYDADDPESGNGNIGNDLRQVPIIHIDSDKSGNSLARDTYTVVVQLLWSKGYAMIPQKGGVIDFPGIDKIEYELIGFDGEAVRGEAEEEEELPFNVYVDAIRVYNPADADLPVILKAYEDAGEYDHYYTEVRDLVLDNPDLSAGGKIEGAIAIDLTPHQKPVLDDEGNPVLDDEGNPVYEYDMPQGDFADLAAAYEQYGPNNEMYLKDRQGFAFYVNTSGMMHISAKTPFGGTMTMKVYAIIPGEEPTYFEYEVNSSTEMYFDCDAIFENFSGETCIVVTASGSGILSVCELKTSSPVIEMSISADYTALELAAAVIGGKKGDVNADGSIDMMDALLTVRAALGGEISAYGSYCADMNNDGIADMQDALAIMRAAFAR